MIAVFTDLDGTLLDHHTYGFDAARPALALVKARRIPLVLASSKTAAEMAPIAAALGTDAPMIVENGAGIAGLDGEAGASDTVYRQIRALLAALPPSLSGKFSGFGDWSGEQVAERTGLSPDAARLARDRRFSEPGLWRGTEAGKRDFLEFLKARGFQAAQGGRFLTIMPEGATKAAAMRRVAAHLAERHGEPIFTIALGDAPNDLAMLEAADRGIVVANPNHTPLPVTARERSGHILRSRLAGPAGWNETIMELLTT